MTERVTPEQLARLLRPARGRSKPGEMNKTEAEYAGILELRKRAGEIAWYAFECVTLKLAKRTTYTPDFMVMLADGTIEIQECKGHWEDDARVKIKVAAEMFPFVFKAMRKTREGWQEETF